MSNSTIAARAHADRVATVSRSVRNFYEKKVPFRIFHGSSNSTRAAARQEIVDISGLKHIIYVDKTKKTALVEPGIAMDELVKHLLPYNLMPAVVPEFPGITAGGAFAGTAAESSSFRYGYFDRTDNSVGMVLGNGDIVHASPKENADLFFGSAGSLGTLGITTQLEVQLVDCGEYVKVTYIPVSSHTEALALFANVGPDVDFIDGLMFSSRHGVVVEGRLVTESTIKPIPIVRFTRARDPWFFAHAHSKIRCQPASGTYQCLTCHWTSKSRTYRQTSTTTTELVPIADFIFRYERGVFWMACYGWAPKLWNRFTRTVFDPLWHTRFQYRVLHLVGGTPHIIQDLAIPAQRADGFVQYLEDELKIYPLWLCPIKQDPRALMHTASTCTDFTTALVNVGVWGSPNYGADFLRAETYDQFIKTNRDIEAKVARVGGLKWLYACNYYSEEEFWRIYDKGRYEGLRSKWMADRLPNLWEKVRRSRQEVREVGMGQVVKALLYAGLAVDRLVT
ncbi:delta-sterol reductase [Parastagonospora nodorum]|nr:delta-sterol reductase [Parastagonospora nodorum]KAH5583885.1 delta-sterol reductase [Parastagonospora nodorum]